MNAINDVELYAVFGGYKQFLSAPRAAVTLATLVLMGKMQAEQERADEARRAADHSGSAAAYR